MGKRVLVVDDNVDFRSAARALLEAAGYQVVAEAGGADEALRVVRETSPDLVLLDVRLPSRDGIALAVDLAALPLAPQVVLVSSRPARVYGERLRRAPVRGFLSKDQLSGPALRGLLGSDSAREDG